ncbi:MAG: DUF962 domain-containing protein [Alphaproteobacteria bacterium]|nr:DUF962 domain-containing protein [Alphaproteobacteria bacterium]
MAPKFESFREFFPYYLAEHADPVCRGLHYIGTTLSAALLIYALYTQNWWFLLAVPLCGYGFAWVGHFVFEKNRPATFDYWRWSLIGDYKMYGLWISGRLAPAMEEALAQHGRRNSKGIKGA